MKHITAVPDLYDIPQESRISSKVRDNILIFLFLTPALLLFFLFVIYPIVQSIYYSLFNWKGFGPAVDFVGLNNFKNILSDKVFLIALRNGLFIIVFSLLLQLPLAMALAVLVGRDLPGRVVFRTLFFLPYVLSEVITAIMWLFLLNPDPSRGFINAVLGAHPRAQGASFFRRYQHCFVRRFCRADLEILWVPHAAVPDRAAEYTGRD